MIKLSKIPDDTMLTVKWSGSNDSVVMDKADLLHPDFFTAWSTGTPRVTVAKKDVKIFCLRSILEDMGYDAYEGWDFQAYEDIMNYPETMAFLKNMKDVLDNRPIYWEGEEVEIDILPELYDKKI